MDVKTMRFLSDRESLSSKLFWSFDYGMDCRNKTEAISLQSIKILDDMMGGDSVEMLPDPITHVVGIFFEKAEADIADRNYSPSSYTRSKGGRDDDTDREMNTPRGIGNITGRDVSGDNLSLRHKEISSATSKDKNKSTLASITNKYTKLKGKVKYFLR